MRKNFILILLLISSFFISENVHAVIVRPISSREKYTTGITWYEHGRGSNIGASQVYKDTVKVINYNGYDYITYCVDPGLTFKSNVEYNCEASTDPGLIYLMSLQNQTDYTTLQLAMRLYASEVGVSSSTLAQMKAAVIRYRQIRSDVESGGTTVGPEIRDGCAESGIVCSTNYTDYLVTSDAASETLINNAWTYYKEALSHHQNNSFTGVSNGNFIITKQSENTVGNSVVITYALSSSAPIEENKVRFECTTCTSINKTWYGQTGTLTVTIPKDQCTTHNVDAYYPASGVQVCEVATHDTSYQRLITNFSTPTDSSEETTAPSATIEVTPYECEGECPAVPEIRGNVNNCCYESRETYVYEPTLNELFCRDTALNIDYYKNRSGNDAYKDRVSVDHLNSDYCELYCTERVRIHTPPAVTAKSGRYFTLELNGVGPGEFNTTSPYIDGARRCRMKIYYDKWETDYINAVKEQVKQYNIYQEKAAHYKMWNDGTTNTGQSLTETISCSCQCTATITCPTTAATGSTTTTTGTTTTTAACTETASASKSSTCTVTYDKYTFPTSNITYYKVKKESDEETNHSYVRIASDGTGVTEYSGWRAYNISYSACATEETNNETSTTATSESGGTCTCTYTCTTDTSNDAESHKADVTGTRSSYKTARDSAKSAFDSAVQTAKSLENDLDKCNNYFTNYEGTNANAMYSMTPSISFKYDQKYINEYGYVDVATLPVTFDQDTPGCKVSGPTMTVDGEDVFSPQYSSLYAGQGFNSVSDFASIHFATSATDYTLDTTYLAPRTFTYDAKYEIDCAWNEEPNTLETLVPSGEVVSRTDRTENITIHEKEYTVYITTFTGRYETKWGLTGIGERGQFDDYIQNNGETCDENPADRESMFTCGLEVTNRIVVTADCNPEPCKTELPLNFKVIDPKNFFPAGTTDSNGKSYAYNWLSTTEGPIVMDKINKKAERDATYAPESITYSFTLNPTAMRHIKNYNVEKNETNGYNDFNFHCECPEEAQTNTLENGGIGCTKCKSKFLDNLEDGFVRYDNNNHTVDVWASSKTLDSIRNSLWGTN